MRLRGRPDAADIAAEVVDDRQAQGIGTDLVRRLARRAAAVGISRFTATVLSETGLRRSLARRGWRLVEADGPSATLEIDVWALLRRLRRLEEAAADRGALTDANEDWWIHTPTFDDVKVVGSVTLPFLPAHGDHPGRPGTHSRDCPRRPSRRRRCDSVTEFLTTLVQIGRQPGAVGRPEPVGRGLGLVPVRVDQRGSAERVEPGALLS